MADEKRLIDANKLYEEMMGEYRKGDYCDGCLDTTINLIDFASTVDAVEVVRCKDCKRWHEETGWCDVHSCFIDNDGEFSYPEESANWRIFDADDFCSYGERRNDNA